MKKIFYITFLTVMALVCASQISSADTIAELQAKIDASNDSKAALEKEIAKYQKQLDTVSTQATTLQNTIKSLDISTSKISTEAKLTQTNITKTSLNIEDTGIQISDKQNKINKNLAVITKTLRQIDQADSSTIIETLLLNEDLSDFWNDLESTVALQTKIREEIVTVQSVKTELEIAKAELEKKQKELTQYNKELAAKKAVLDSTKKEKSTLLTTTKNTQANYAKILAEKKALMDAFDKELAGYESQLKMIIDPHSFPPSGKGILAWPLDTVRITQNFGYTSFAKTAYASGYHNGADFAASIGTKLKSAGNGVVEGVGNTDTVCPGASFGKWVFIRYDNGLASTYGHLSLITVAAGQRVSTGEVVGYTGNTGYSTGPHLHMSVYASQGVKISTLKSAVCKGTYTMPIADPKAYLDPLTYL
jgi:murein DD-endopeptidase MepM/ murein hydrolase activator NlpD